MGAAQRDVRVPLLVALSALACVVIVAAALGHHPWDSSTWARWDSGLYEDIARNGYEVFPCEEEPDKWCGDAAFPRRDIDMTNSNAHHSLDVLNWFAAARLHARCSRRGWNRQRSTVTTSGFGNCSTVTVATHVHPSNSSAVVACRPHETSS
jgi:hypothetical protein